MQDGRERKKGGGREAGEGERRERMDTWVFFFVFFYATLLLLVVLFSFLLFHCIILIFSLEKTLIPFSFHTLTLPTKRTTNCLQISYASIKL